VVVIRANEGLDLLRVLQKGAHAGNVAAMKALSAYDLHANRLQHAFLWAKKAAQTGNPRAEVFLAKLYASGRGTTKNLPKAIVWAKKAAARHDSLGLYLLGYLHQHGEGFPMASRRRFHFTCRRRTRVPPGHRWRSIKSISMAATGCHPTINRRITGIIMRRQAVGSIM
jgi:TPR repeat protein